MFKIIIGVFVALCALVEIVYLILLHGGCKEIDRQTKERMDAIEPEKNFDFDFGVTVDKVRFGDEP